MTTRTLCPYCRIPLDDNGAPVEGKHDPSCADRPLEQSELKQLFRHRPGQPQKTETRSPDTGRIEWEAYQVTAEENLKTVLNDNAARVPVSRVLGELAALCQMADANRSVPTDRGRRGHGDSLPSFDPAAAQRELEKAADRLHAESEKLAGVTRNPHRSPEAECQECGKRVRVVDVYCGPCGARILREHRRGA